MGRTQCAYDFPRSRGQVVSRMERLGARSKTAYRESGTDRFNPTPITPGKSHNRKLTHYPFPGPLMQLEEIRNQSAGEGSAATAVACFFPGMRLVIAT